MKTPNNPFVLSGYFGKKWFCDREQELDMLQDHLHNERNVVLYAWRRMGKTALIKCLSDHEHRANKTESVYVDLLATQDLSEAIKAITKAVHQTYGRTSDGLSAALRRLFSAIGVTIRFDPLTGAPKISLGLNDPVVPERSFQAIGEFLAQRKKQVVVALDEFQQVTDYKEKNAEAVFRTWMQQFPDIRFIYCGSHRGMMQAMFTEKKRPFYQSAQLMALDSIPEREYARFIQRHFSAGGKSIDKPLIHQIYQWSRGQTYCIQLVCNYLFGHRESLNEEELETVFSYLLDREAPVFAGFQKILTDTQWAVIRAIAREEPLRNPMGKEFILKHRLGATSTVNATLKALEKKELVVQDQGAWYVHEVLLARWLQRL